MQIFDGQFSFAAGIEDERGFGRAAEQGADLATGAAHGVVFHRAGGRKKKQQQGALAPGADGGRSGSDGEHEEVDIELTGLEAIPGILGGIPPAAEVGQRISCQRETAGGMG